eukprot:434103_1
MANLCGNIPKWVFYLFGCLVAGAVVCGVGIPLLSPTDQTTSQLEPTVLVNSDPVIKALETQLVKPKVNDKSTNEQPLDPVLVDQELDETPKLTNPKECGEDLCSLSDLKVQHFDTTGLTRSGTEIQIDCAGTWQYVSTNNITMEKVDIQFAKTQSITPAEKPGCWNCPAKKCDVYTSLRGKYVGQLDKKGAYHGVGIYYYRYNSSGDVYRGQWVHGNSSGIGEYIWRPDGSIYLGQFKNDHKNGRGKFTWKLVGKSYSGEWVNEEMKEGMFTVTSEDGTS